MDQKFYLMAEDNEYCIVYEEGILCDDDDVANTNNIKYELYRKILQLFNGHTISDNINFKKKEDCQRCVDFLNIFVRLQLNKGLDLYTEKELLTELLDRQIE